VEIGVREGMRNQKIGREREREREGEEKVLVCTPNALNVLAITVKVRTDRKSSQ